MRRRFDCFRVARDGWLGNPALASAPLSIPCAAGEEPYSIAIALLELGLAPSRFLVHGVDISGRRLDQARRGVYSANALRMSQASFRDRYFRTMPQGFELEETIRDRVTFFRASILAPTLEGEPPYDAVFCRNLLIYLHEASRTMAMAVLDRLLARDGLLFIGHADRLSGTQGMPRFLPVGDAGAFAYRRATGSESTKQAGIGMPTALPAPTLLRPVALPAASPQPVLAAADRVSRTQPAPVLSPAATSPPQPNHATERPLEQDVVPGALRPRSPARHPPWRRWGAPARSP